MDKQAGGRAGRGGKKRVLTAARREQNRLAQRVWRLKQRGSKNDEDATGTAGKGDASDNARVATTSESIPAQGYGSSDDATVLDLGPGVNELLDSAAVCPLAMFFSESTSAAALVTPPSAHKSSPSTTPISTKQSQGETQPTSFQTSYTNALTSLVSPTPARIMTPIDNLLFLALLDNALALGFDLTNFTACSPAALSPFYREDASPSDDPQMLLARAYSPSEARPYPPLSLQDSPPACESLSASASRPRSLPRSLQPTLSQILIPHHPSLDLVPLPTLRDRALQLSAIMPRSFSIWGLLHDILMHGGLSIWAAADNGCSDIDLIKYQAWDERRWVAAPWFEKKWKLAVNAWGSGRYLAARPRTPIDHSDPLWTDRCHLSEHAVGLVPAAQ